MKNTTYEEMSTDRRELLDAAEKVMEFAYNPYSKFFVGAALRTQSGIIIPGNNVENAAYGSTICAERGALMRANSEKHTMFDGIAIIAKGATFDTKDVTGPCGSCRQMLYEARQISEKDLFVILSTTKKDKIIITSMDELLPLAFGPLDLGIDVGTYRRP